MRFANFDLEASFEAIVLVGLGHEWDLHNFAFFLGVSEGPNQAKLLDWSVPQDVQNPWGSPGNTATGCRLVFAGVKKFELRPGLPEKAQGAHTVSGISKVVPGEEEYPFRMNWGSGEPFDLRVEFEDDARIDIDAELATLEAIPRA